MTANETLKLYQLFFQLTKNESQAKNFVAEFESSIDSTVETKFEKEEKRFSPRIDIQDLKHEMKLLRAEIKADNAEFRAEIEKRLNQQILWILTTGIAVVGLIVTFIKLKL